MESNETLDMLLANGTIKEIKFDTVDCEGNVGKHSDFRNSERLTLVFPSGDVLVIDTICSGCMENASLIISGTSTTKDA